MKVYDLIRATAEEKAAVLTETGLSAVNKRPLCTCCTEKALAPGRRSAIMSSR